MGSFEYMKCLTGDPKFTNLERQLEIWILELQTSKRSRLFAEIEGFALCFQEGAENGNFMSHSKVNSDFGKAFHKLLKHVCFLE